MKKIILCNLLLLLTFACLSQKLETAQHTPSVDYLKKSKTQKAIAWVLMSAGVAGLLVTVASEANNTIEDGLTTIFSLGTIEPEPAGNYTVPYLLSAAAVGGSIILFVSASKNRKRSNITTAFKIEKIPILLAQDISNQSYACIAFKLKL